MKPAGTIPLPGWLQSQTTQNLLSCIPHADETVRFVGGCIRDTLLGLPVKDIDIATIYSPQFLRLLMAITCSLYSFSIFAAMVSRRGK